MDESMFEQYLIFDWYTQLLCIKCPNMNHYFSFFAFDSSSSRARWIIAFYVFFYIFAIFLPKCLFKSIVFFLG